MRKLFSLRIKDVMRSARGEDVLTLEAALGNAFQPRYRQDSKQSSQKDCMRTAIPVSSVQSRINNTFDPSVWCTHTGLVCVVLCSHCQVFPARWYENLYTELLLVRQARCGGCVYWMRYFVKTEVKSKIQRKHTCRGYEISKSCHKGQTCFLFLCHSPVPKCNLRVKIQFCGVTLNNAMPCSLLMPCVRAWATVLIPLAPTSLFYLHSLNECHLIAGWFGNTVGSAFRKPFSKLMHTLNAARWTCMLIISGFLLCYVEVFLHISTFLHLSYV